MRTSLAIAVGFLLLLCVLPVGVVLVDSFVGDSGLTFAHYAAAFGHAHRWQILFDSLRIAGASTLFALLLGVPYAFFVTRVRTPLRGIFGGLYLLPLVLPPLLSAMGWTLFLRDVKDRPGFPGPDSMLGGISGCAFLFGLAYFPFVVLFAKKAFLEIGAGLEEAARISAGPVRAFVRVTLRLSVPAILAGALFVFLFALADFSVVDYLSTVAPVKDSVRAYPFEAFSAWGKNFEQVAGRREAAALGLPLAALSIGLLLLTYLLVRKGQSVTVVSGHIRPGFVEDRSSRATRLTLRIGGFLFLSAVILLAVGIPIGRIFKEAIGRNHDLIGNLRRTLYDPGNARVDLGHSLVYSAIAAFAMTLLATVLGHHMVRRGPRREALILTLAFLPLAFGPIMFGAGLMRTWNHPFLELPSGRNPIYDTSVVVVFMLVGKYLPFALAAVTTTMRRIDPGYEEAAAVAGVGWLRRMLDIVAPLAGRGIVAGLVLGFVFSLRELDTIVLLTAGNRTVMMKIYTMVHIAHDSDVASLSILLVALIAIPFLIWSVLATRKSRAM